MSITPEAMARYRATAERRQRAQAAEDSARRARALDAAAKAAKLLREEYGATRVVVFGSLVEEGGRLFGLRSDIDLATWELQEDRYFEALGRLQGLAPEFGVDVVEMERCPARLVEPIREWGVDL